MYSPISTVPTAASTRRRLRVIALEGPSRVGRGLSGSGCVRQKRASRATPTVHQIVWSSGTNALRLIRLASAEAKRPLTMFAVVAPPARAALGSRRRGCGGCAVGACSGPQGLCCLGCQQLRRGGELRAPSRSSRRAHSGSRCGRAGRSSDRARRVRCSAGTLGEARL